MTKPGVRGVAGERRHAVKMSVNLGAAVAEIFWRRPRGKNRLPSDDGRPEGSAVVFDLGALALRVLESKCLLGVPPFVLMDAQELGEGV